MLDESPSFRCNWGHMAITQEEIWSGSEWDLVLAAARQLAASADEPCAGPRYATEFGLALLELARAPERRPDECDLLYLQAEGWLSDPRRRGAEILARLARQLATCRRFAYVPATTRRELDRLVAAIAD